MSYIRRALDVGFPLPQESAADPALASLRRHAEFRSLEPEEKRRKSIAAASRGKHSAGKYVLTMFHGLSYAVPESWKTDFVGLEAEAELLPIRDWSQQDRFADYLWESHFWLDSWGRILETQATFADSKAQVLATRVDSEGNQWVERASTWHAADGGIQHWLEHSTDAGRSWNLMAQRFTNADQEAHSYRTQGLLSPDEAPHHDSSNPMDTLQPPSKQPSSGQRRQQLRRSS
ncbi:MAG: hypothetical protein NXI32_01730 [bacterium]|nr:hypothetical protein [bacterium]